MKTKNFLPLALVGGLVATAGLASATNFPIAGDVPGANPFLTILAVVFIAGVAFLGLFFGIRHLSAKGRETTKGWVPAAKTFGIIVAAGLLILPFANNGGGAFLTGSGSPAPVAAPAASVAGAPNGYASSVTATYMVRDAATNAVISGATLTVYQNSSGYTVQQERQASVASYGGCTSASDGTCVLSNFPAGVYDYCVSATNYYKTCVFHDATLTTVPLNINTGNGVVTVTPPITLMAFGTMDLSKTSTSISSGGCAAGVSTCPLTILYGNSAANTYVRSAAVKITPTLTNANSGSQNLTFAALQPNSQCQYTAINGLTYVWDPNFDIMKAGQYTSCAVYLTYAGSSTDGKITLAMDDLFIPNYYKAMAASPGLPAGDFETNSNVNGASATTATITR